MAIIRRTPPSYHSGYAHSAGESAYPDLWKGLTGAWIPSLGPTGNIVRDLSAGRHDGTLTTMDPATDWVIGGNPRVPGYVLDFDAVSDHILVSPDIPVPPAGSRKLTYAFWIRVPVGADATNNNIISWGDRRSCKIGGVTDSFINCFSDGTSSGSAVCSSAIDDGVWHFIAYTSVPNAQTIYFDAVEEDTATEGWSTDAPGLTIGKRHGVASQYLDGSLGPIYMYLEILTQAQITQLFEIPLAPFILREHVGVKEPVAGDDVNARAKFLPLLGVA